MNVVDLSKLAREQEYLSKLVKREDDSPFSDSIVTGVDVSYSNDSAMGCAVVSNITTHEILSITIHKAVVNSE